MGRRVRVVRVRRRMRMRVMVVRVVMVMRSLGKILQPPTDVGEQSKSYGVQCFLNVFLRFSYMFSKCFLHGILWLS